jgi:hypothetical protein
MGLSSVALFHICPASLWPAAMRSGVTYFGWRTVRRGNVQSASHGPLGEVFRPRRDSYGVGRPSGTA